MEGQATAAASVAVAVAASVAVEVIVLDDDTDEEAHKHADGHPHEHQNEDASIATACPRTRRRTDVVRDDAETAVAAAAVAQMRSVLPHLSRRRLRQGLAAGQGNVSVALAWLLDDAATTRTAITTATTGVAATNATGALSRLSQLSPCHKKRPRRTLPTQQAHGLEQPADTEAEDFAHLSPAWHACYERTLALASVTDGIFCDADFGPVATSLDGRRRLATDTESGAKTTTVLCRCGLPVAARQVQSDGPNYGRFYLVCGRPRQRASVASTASPASPQRKEACRFFQWDPQGSLGDGGAGGGYASSGRWVLLAWHHFGDTTAANTSLYQTRIGPDQVQQGAVGNCWFLSALAVVAEQAHLVKRILPHDRLNAAGVYQVNLCLEGAWQPVIVDSYLPVVHRDATRSTKQRQQQQHATATSRSQRQGVPLPGQPGILAVPAFCATPGGQLWAALVEKAYAKAHGSYAQLSGGFIAEGLADLTGAPCETILFTMVDRELLWARLLSFVQAGFGMGVATSGRTTTKGSGLVGGHAYSVLDVRQLDDVVVGAQAKVTDFFGASLGKASTAAGLSSSAAAALTTSYTTSTTVRLVQIRNPWGSKEWKGDWSAQSVQWTQKLRQRLPDSWRQGDGTFFMSFEDMLQNFHHMDVCKTQEGWQHTSAMGTWQSGMREPLQSSRRCYRLRPLFQASYAYVSIIQPKKRANTQSHFWYTDNSLVLLQRRIGTDREEAWSTAACSLSGVQRSTTLEVFLDPQKYEYICLSYACSPQSHHTPFRVTVYSGQKVQIEETPLEEAYARAALEVIHKHLLKVEHKLIYPLCQGCILVCSQQSNGCYFVALNATDYHVSLRLTVEAPKDIHVVYRGARDDTHDIPAGCQRILLVLSGSGKSSMTATQCPFRYASAVEQRRPSPSTAPMVSGAQLPAPSTSLGGSIGLTMAGELLATQAASHVALEGCRGQDSLDTFAWIPQLGAAATSGC